MRPKLKLGEALARAADLRKRANAATDPIWKAELLQMELAWLGVVESYRFVSQANCFLADVYARRSEKLAQTGVKSVGVGPPRGGLEGAGNRSSLADLLDVLVCTAIEQSEGKARAAFYLADANRTELRHIIGMPQAYARYVDGFAISPQSLACGVAAATGHPVITSDVTEEPRWKDWLWLAKQFDYRACWSFPVSTSSGKIMGSFAMYYRDPREATPRDLDLAAVLTRSAATIISRH